MTGLGPTPNTGIADPAAPGRILAAAADLLDWGIAWCCVLEGMHPTQIIRLRSPAFDGQMLHWIRVKNEKPRRTLIGPEDKERLLQFLALMDRPATRPTRKTIWQRSRLMVARAGFEGGPRVLRKTFILNELRKHRGRADMMDLVAIRAGCTRETVAQHYLDLDQWEGLYGGR
jgi:hypothetical protein